MDRRPQFEHFPLTREQVRTLTDQKVEAMKEYSENRQQIMKISQKNIPQANLFLQRLYQRGQILQQKMNWINEVMQTNELLSAKLHREEKNNYRVKEKSKQLINSYKNAVIEKKARESFQKEREKSNELIMIQNSQRLYQLQREQQQGQKAKKKQILQSYLDEHRNKTQGLRGFSPKNTQQSFREGSLTTTNQEFAKNSVDEKGDFAKQYLNNQMKVKMMNNKQRSSMDMKEVLGSTDSKLMKMGSYSINS